LDRINYLHGGPLRCPDATLPAAPRVPDPLSLLPLALAAHGGRVDGYESQQLVAAGLTLLQRSAPLVRALAGRRSAILLPTSPAFVTALAASDGRGAVLINPLASATEVAYQLRDADVGAVFTISALADRVPAGVAIVLLDDAPKGATVVAAGASRQVDLGSHFGLSLEGDPQAPGLHEEVAIVYTSAMAGTPLGAILTHRNLLSNARGSAQAAGNTSGDVVLSVLPMSHLFGLVVATAAPLLSAARVVTMPRFSASDAWRLVHGEGVTEIVGVPAMYHAMLAAAERTGGARDHTLRLCICGGAPLPRDLQDRWAEATGVELRQGYGLTESGPVALFSRADAPNVRGSIGTDLPGAEVSIRDTAGAPLPTGQPGEICVRGPGVSPGYVSGGEHGLRRQDGWLHTGDLGSRNADGTVSFAGVARAMFTHAGFNVYPREIERVIGGMPGVAGVEVRGEPDPVREHQVVARVSGAVDAEAVSRWCADHLAVYKRPARIEITG
jgi:long-chain acyl-CoA synthetase